MVLIFFADQAVWLETVLSVVINLSDKETGLSRIHLRHLVHALLSSPFVTINAHSSILHQAEGLKKPFFLWLCTVGTSDLSSKGHHN